MNHLLDLLLARLGLERTCDVDERIAELALAFVGEMASVRSDLDDLKARVSEFDLAGAKS